MTISLRQVAGYSLVDTKPALNIRQVTGYSLVDTPKPISVRQTYGTAAVSAYKGVRLRQQAGYAQIKYSVGYIRNIQGYALTVPATTVDGSKPGLTSLYALINLNAKMVFTPSNLMIGTPSADSTNSTTNTKVQVTAVGRIGYIGSAFVYYTRVGITRIFTNQALLISIPSATTIYNLISAINAAYNVGLVQDDLVDGPVAAGTTILTLTVANGSYQLRPGSTVTLQ